MASFFSSRWCGLVSAIWSRNSLQMDSWLVGYHARCVVVWQWYSVQPCTAHKLVLPKTLSKWSSRKTDSAASCGTKDLKWFKYTYLKMLTQLWEVWIWFRYVSMMMYDDHIIHDNDAFFCILYYWAQANPSMLLGVFHHMWKWRFHGNVLVAF